MNFGLSKEEFEFITRTVVLPLTTAGAVVWCFGSRARGTHQQFSDLDLMVESDNDLSLIVAEIREILQESHFPYIVDLVEYRNFAESYRENYNREKVRFSCP